MSDIIIPEILKKARRALDEITFLTLLHDWCSYEADKCWYIKIQLNLQLNSCIIPNISDWYIVTKDSYPHSRVWIFPSASNSLTMTLHHQNCNAKIEENNLWRKGDLCLALSEIKLKSSDVEYSNINDENIKLLWHVQRLIKWIEAACTNSLVNDKDLFEMPDFSVQGNDVFVFSEDQESYNNWQNIKIYKGYVDLSVYKTAGNIYVAKNFMDLKENSIFSYCWGNYFNEKPISEITAVWILLKQIPVMNIWQAPMTFLDLQEICKKYNIDLLNFLRNLKEEKIRNKKNNLFLVGFPIPKFIKGKDEIIFWQAFKMPILTNRTTLKGFRAAKMFECDRVRILKDDYSLNWIKSQNLNLNEITSRGKIDISISSKNILIIGAGCIGSTFSELLVRSGALNIRIMDEDVFNFGNLSRHTLSMEDIKHSKSEYLSKRLNSLFPHAKINSVSENINSKINLEKFDIIVDCSGSNEVLNVIENMKLTKKTIVFSISIGFAAQYLYISFLNDIEIKFDSFKKLITPFIKEDMLKTKEIEFPREGIGCWHPIFPARSDDIWTVSSISLKVFEKCILDNSSNNLSVVYKKSIDEKTYGYIEIARN